MRKGMLKHFVIFFLLSIVIMRASYATTGGFYLGAMAGPYRISGGSLQGIDNDGFPVLVTPNSQGTAGRLFMGYKGVYFGVETGGTYFSVVNFSPNPPFGGKTGIATWDVFGTASFNICQFGLFAKLGAAAIYQGSSQGSFPTFGNQKYTGYVRPIAAIGAGIDLTPRWVADISWTRLFNVRILKNVDFLALGISYHFVDVYCGQFLCDE